MIRRQVGSVITAVAAIGFLATAAYHSSGYSSVVRMAAEAPERVRSLLPMLWLGISFDFTIVGLIVAVVALRPRGPARIILAVAAICPFAAAGLQLRFIGFIPPTAILIGVGVMTLVAAIILPSTRVTQAGVAR
jgi:hypothetical protein